jgi:hypothetical protein
VACHATTAAAWAAAIGVANTPPLLFVIHVLFENKYKIVIK